MLLAALLALAIAAATGSLGRDTSAATVTSVLTQRAGTTASKPVTVVGLGDSVTAGGHCDCTTFIDGLATALSARDHRPTAAINLGVDGLTAAGLLQQLQDAAVSRSVAAGDVVVITVGANDLQPAFDLWAQTEPNGNDIDQGRCGDGCADTTLDAVGADVGAVVARVRQLRSGRPTRILVTDYWNVFEDGAIAMADRGPAYLRWSDTLTRRLNKRTCAAAAAWGATCVDLYAPFKGDGTADPTALLTDDGDHPDARGNALISQVLLAATPE